MSDKCIVMIGDKDTIPRDYWVIGVRGIGVVKIMMHGTIINVIDTHDLPEDTIVFLDEPIYCNEECTVIARGDIKVITLKNTQKCLQLEKVIQ